MQPAKATGLCKNQSENDKNRPDATAAVLVAAHELTLYLAHCQPFLPFTAQKMTDMLRISPAKRKTITSGEWATRAGRKR